VVWYGTMVEYLEYLRVVGIRYSLSRCLLLLLEFIRNNNIVMLFVGFNMHFAPFKPPFMYRFISGDLVWGKRRCGLSGVNIILFLCRPYQVSHVVILTYTVPNDK
jgi:hypothetical protein